MNYTNILSPKTNKFVSIYSNSGKKIIKKYIKTLIGGFSSSINKQSDCIPLTDLEFEITCPLSLEIMEDPVIAADGHTYEREMIKRWFNENRRKEYIKSPATGKNLSDRRLIPNQAIKKVIATWNEAKQLNSEMISVFFSKSLLIL